MKIQELAAGMKVVHNQYGEGIVQSVSNVDASVLFGQFLRTVDPGMLEYPSLAPEEPKAVEVKAAKVVPQPRSPQEKLLDTTVREVLAKLGVPDRSGLPENTCTSWNGGKLVLHPADPTLQTKEVPLEVFFHKIVGIRNQLRVLEQKINAHDRLNDGQKLDVQQHITNTYDALSSFNVLFVKESSGSAAEQS